VRGSAILRDLRRLSSLPLRRETIIHLALHPDGAESHSLNRLIAADPALALAALRLTPRYIRDHNPGIAQIARFLTRQAIRDVVKTSPWNTRGAVQDMVLDRVWSHSLATAHAVRQLSRTQQYHHPQSAFLAGLLHNLGLLAVVAVSPDAVGELLEHENGKASILLAEKNRFGAAHTTIGSQLAQRWGLPLWLAEVARWHHHTRGGLPGDLTDRKLVELTRDGDQLLANSDFALGVPCSHGKLCVPTGMESATLCSGITGAVRKLTTYLTKHASAGTEPGADEWARQAVDLATQNAALQGELNWQSRAWEEFRRLPVDAAPADLTALVAETFRDALGALGVCCYVRSVNGTAAEGSFCGDGLRPVACEIEPGKSSSHVEQVVMHLRAVWQNRPYRAISIESGEETLAHVLLWIDEYSPAPAEESIEQVRSTCASWLARAAYTAHLESQIESFDETLRNQSAELDLRVEHSKLAALAEMAAGAGHEFNNPLAVISGRAQLLIAEESDPRRRKSLETIVSQAQRIHRMIVDLMFFARPPAPECKPTSIAELVDRAVASVQREAEQMNVSLCAMVPSDLPPVDGDIAQLAAAVECILRNSLEATPENGSVEITAQALGKHTVQLRICDTGRGITDEQRQHIFEPFYCGREAGRGLGMGLPKAWSIVQNHKGELAIDKTESGSGTTVTIRLPALASDTQQRACA
jgi:signal transduction histidine kinase/HD-like signal output (HDOD) protein